MTVFEKLPVLNFPHSLHCFCPLNCVGFLVIELSKKQIKSNQKQTWLERRLVDFVSKSLDAGSFARTDIVAEVVKSSPNNLIKLFFCLYLNLHKIVSQMLFDQLAFVEVKSLFKERARKYLVFGSLKKCVL